MKRLVFTLLSLVLISACLEAGPAVEGTEKSSADIIREFKEGSMADNRFAFDLFSMYAEKEGNIFFSPYSISTALAMTYEGARGRTAEEIREVFYFPENITLMRASQAATYERLNPQDAEYELSTANALWTREGRPFLEEYLQTVETHYRGKATELDFAGDPDGSRVIINDWVEDQTNQKIEELLPKNSIKTDTAIVLTNAIYFKGDWMMQFDPSLTEEADFYVTPSRTESAEMMALKGERPNYAETDELRAVELPYNGSDLSMLVILSKGNLSDLERSLDSEDLYDIRQRLHSARMDVYLPKFKLEEKYEMGRDLVAMGMPTAFSPGADFSGMAEDAEYFFISEVFHKAFVDVNEEGTEAAAATGVVIRETAVVLEEPEPFRADRPFIFLIQERETGRILFMGRFSEPPSQ